MTTNTVTATVSGQTATQSITVRRPKWDDVYAGYPKTADGYDLPAPDVFTSILGPNYNTAIFSNACATRVSLGLLAGGMSVKKDFLISQGTYSGKGFIASALNLKNWLSRQSVWGAADVSITNPSDLASVSAKINGRNGVYIIVGGFGPGISGHATLWVGANNNAIGGNHYVDNGGDVYFWELK